MAAEAPEETSLQNKDLKSLKLAFVPGTGNMGGGLARLYARAGFNVIVGSRQVDKAQTKVNEIKASLTASDDSKSNTFDNITAATNEDASSQGDIIFWCIQAKEEQRYEALRALGSNYFGKVVIDVTNIMYARDESAWGQTSATTLNKQVTDEMLEAVRKDNPDTKDVYWCSAFKGTFAKLFNDDAPLNEKYPASIIVTGDNKDARLTTINLINETKKFKGIDGGELKYSKIIDLLGPLYIMTIDKNNNNGARNGYWTWQSPNAQ